MGEGEATIQASGEAQRQALSSPLSEWPTWSDSDSVLQFYSKKDSPRHASSFGRSVENWFAFWWRCKYKQRCLPVPASNGVLRCVDEGEASSKSQIFSHLLRWFSAMKTVRVRNPPPADILEARASLHFRQLSTSVWPSDLYFLRLTYRNLIRELYISLYSTKLVRILRRMKMRPFFFFFRNELRMLYVPLL